MPSIERIAISLREDYEKETRLHWGLYVKAVLAWKESQLEEVESFKKESPNAESILAKSSPWDVAREDFTEYVLMPVNDDSPFALQNARVRYTYYSKLLKLAEQIEEKSEVPSCRTIQMLTGKIKNSTEQIINPTGCGMVTLKEGYLSGSNVVVDFFSGLIGVLAAAVLAISSIVYGTYASLANEETYYFGTLPFIKDMICEFVVQLEKVLALAGFPFAMACSKLDTGSWNILKGRRMRALDGFQEICAKDVEETQVLLPL